MSDTIIVEEVTKEYGDTVKTRALRGVSLRVAESDFLFVVGQSGSGKSTLLNMLGLLDRPTTGTVRLLGTDVGALGNRDRAAFRNDHMGFVFQFHHLLPEFSVKENLLIPTWIHPVKRNGRSADRAAKRAADILAFLGLGDLVDKNAEQLSGGEKQRVAVGRALMNTPDVVLADEPTGNLDTENSELVHDLFRRIHREMGTTFVIVTHDTTIAAETDRIIEIRDGLVSRDGRNDQG